jgi:hypothetical protein
MGQRPTQGDEKSLRPATTLYRTVAPSFVIPSEAERSAVSFSPSADSETRSDSEDSRPNKAS